MRDWWIRLEATCAARRCFRAYEIAVGTDLFGAWMVKWRGRHFTINQQEYVM
jgi:hypothetical protein